MSGNYWSNRPALGRTIASSIIVVVVMLPLLWVVFLAFKPRDAILSDPLSFEGLTLDNFATVLETVPLLRAYLNTLIIVVPSVLIGTVASFMLSVALTLMRFRWPWLQSSLTFYVLAGLAIPVYILLFPVYRLDLALGLFGTYWSLILPYAAISIPFNALLMTGFLRGVPGEIIEAAIIDGAGLTRVSVSVVLPLMRPVLATTLVFNVLYVVNEFPFVSILINDPDMATVSLIVSRFQGQYSVDYGAMMAASVLILIPQLVLYVLFQRQVVSGLTLGAVK